MSPDVPFAGGGDQIITEPGPADVTQRNDRADRERENRDGFSAAGDGTAPSGIGQAQDRGNESAGMADADPKNEIGDIESPEHGRVQSPNSDAVIELIAERGDTRENQARAEGYRDPIPGSGAIERPDEVSLDLFGGLVHGARNYAPGN